MAKKTADLTRVTVLCPICERKQHKLITFHDKDGTILHYGIECLCGRLKVDSPSFRPGKEEGDDAARQKEKLDAWYKSGAELSNVLQRFKIA